MAAKPETTFIAAIHRKLPGSLHREKMNNPYRSGTADVWYSGKGGDLWVEYKFIPKLAVRVPNKIGLSDLQLLWLRGRHNEGRNVAVIVGHPEGCVLMRFPFAGTMDTADIRALSKSRDEIASWILSQTGPPL